MNDLDSDTIPLKIVLIGEAGVGKTSIISQFIDKIFQEDLQASTGGTFCSKTLNLENGQTIKFDIWDTAGQEKYRSLTKLFYKDSSAAILVYDITRQDSFDELKNYWAKQITEETTNSKIILVVDANISDLSEKEVVDELKVRKFPEEINALFCISSAKSSIGINELFLEIAKKYRGNNDIKVKKEEGKKEEQNEIDEEKDDEMFKKVGRMKITKEKLSVKIKLQKRNVVKNKK